MSLRRALWLAPVLALAFALPSCGSDDADGGREPASSGNEARDPLGKKLAAQSDQVSDADNELLSGMGDYSARWNRAAAPLIRDYLDPNVSADQWVRESEAHLQEMRQALLDMRADTVAIQDDELRRFQLRLLRNFEARLGALTAIRSSVAAGDAAGEQQAAERLDRLNLAVQQRAERMIELMRPYIDPERLRELARERSAIVGKALDD